MDQWGHPLAGSVQQGAVTHQDQGVAAGLGCQPLAAVPPQKNQQCPRMAKSFVQNPGYLSVPTSKGLVREALQTNQHQVPWWQQSDSWAFTNPYSAIKQWTITKRNVSIFVQ